MGSKKSLAERFHAKVGPLLPNGCKEWQAQVYPNGYGCITVKKPQRALAHRVAYALLHGEIPEGKQVLHSCDNPRCVNTDHLRLGTIAENIGDMVDRCRTRKSRLLPHLRHICVMRTLGYSQQAIADKYGVSRPMISLLFNDHVPSLRSL